MGDSNSPAPRLVTADRKQIQLRPYDLESILPPDHRARAVWAIVERLDLSAFYDRIKARGSEPGRSATDPKVLVALWLYATAEGVGAARELERLCEEHRAYQWLRGGVPVNYHTLSDFRVQHGAGLDELLTQVLAALLSEKLISLKRVSQDGLRVRASAGTESFRRRKRLKDYLKMARRQVQRVKREAEDGELSARQKAAAQRVARERVERLERALIELGKVEVVRSQQTGGRKARGEPRASATDPEARKLRMGDGGYRPGYNVQLATETQNNVIVGVAVTNGLDQGEAVPMIEQIEQRTGNRPKEYLVDGGYTGKTTVEGVSELGVTLYGPVVERWGQDPFATKPKDSLAVAQWRKRMASTQAQEIYRERAEYSERVNADVRTHRTLDRMLVRGTNKVLCVALWNALTYNILRWITLAGST